MHHASRTRTVLAQLHASAMRIILACAAAALVAGVSPPPGGYPEWTATRLFSNVTTDDTAVCLDGSPPLYYVSPGWGAGANKYLLHMEGGAWCGSPEECVGWWGYRSTLVDPDVLPQDAQASTGYFNRSEPKNSMADWTWVFIRYCDGFSFSSDVDAPAIVPLNVTANATVTMRGLRVLRAVQADLLTRGGMAAATDVVVGGCSAGGMAVFIHCDGWAAAIAAAGSGARVTCLADSGWFPLIPDAGFPSPWFNGVWSGAFTRLNASAAAHASCLAAHNASDAWQCIMPEVAARHTATPLFMYQSAYDSFQIFNMERCIPMPPDPKSPCSDADVTRWGAQLITANVLDWLQSPGARAAGSAAFIDSCYHHCGTWADFDQVVSWSGPGGNVSASQAFAAWRASPATAIWQQPHAYPCTGTTCCGAHGPDSLEDGARACLVH